jgi:hypothetical protein
MDSKKLAQLIKLVVEQEIKKQLPKMIKEEVSKLLNETTTPKPKKDILEEVDPFELATLLLEKDRTTTTNIKEEVRQVQPVKQLSRNSTINEILNQTIPFTSAQRSAGQVGGGSSILDNYQVEQPINEGYSNSHIPNYMDAEPDIDETISYGGGAQGGIETMRSQMASKMGYGDMGGSGIKKGGLGVTTGLAGLDRILNRDNSELVKRFKK